MQGVGDLGVPRGPAWMSQWEAVGISAILSSGSGISPRAIVHWLIFIYCTRLGVSLQMPRKYRGTRCHSTCLPRLDFILAKQVFTVSAAHRGSCWSYGTSSVCGSGQPPTLQAKPADVLQEGERCSLSFCTRGLVQKGRGSMQ